jgi:hypothetical protein
MTVTLPINLPADAGLLPVPPAVVNAGDRAAHHFLEFSQHRSATRTPGAPMPGRSAISAAASRIGSCPRSPLSRWFTLLPSRRTRATAIRADPEAALGGDPDAVRRACHQRHLSPANAVRGPRHVVKRGKTPVLDAREARQPACATVP